MSFFKVIFHLIYIWIFLSFQKNVLKKEIYIYVENTMNDFKKISIYT